MKKITYTNPDLIDCPSGIKHSKATICDFCGSNLDKIKPMTTKEKQKDSKSFFDMSVKEKKRIIKQASDEANKMQQELMGQPEPMKEPRV